MRLFNNHLPLLICGVVILNFANARRIKVQPVREQEQEESIEYYAAEPQEEAQQQQQHQRVVLVSADQYNGLYGQPTAASRSAHQDNYIPVSRAKPSHILAKTKEHAKTPPVQTIKNYNKVNDDGSFTFGYEAADGSFKEETRGTDCVVRGKYGYVDPDGNKREFTYVSGNPCDPNAPKDEQEESDEREANAPDNGPANYPTHPPRPLRPVHIPTAPKAVTYFQNNYDQGEEEQPEPEQLLRHQPLRRPTYITRPQYVQQNDDDSSLYQRQQLIASTTPASIIYRQSVSPINITPRPVSSTIAAATNPPATTYRPQLVQVAVTPRPNLVYTKQLSSLPSTIATPLRQGGSIDFDAEFQKFQQENNIVSPTPSSVSRTTPKLAKTTSAAAGSGQIYSSALVYDPNSGQYNTQLYQTLPQTSGDFTLNQRIQPYVHQPQRPEINIQQLQQQSPLYTSSLRQPTNSQALYQQQQAETQFQNSAQLYAQQQRARSQQHRQPLYYYQPSPDQSSDLSSGQIESFLRGHNIQF